MMTLGAAAAEPKRVLILFPFGHDAAPFRDVAEAFRTTLARDLGGPVDFYQVPLDLARYQDSEEEAPLVDLLKARVKHDPVDLVVLIGGPTVQFAARNRDRLFPTTPILVVTADPRFISAGFLRTNATVVTYRINLPGMVEDILQLQPQTTNIVVVFGASALENFWAGECRREFQSFTNRVGFTWLNGLSLDQTAERCAALPPHSFILHGLFLVDGAGVPCENNDLIRRLHEVANAPLFACFASEFGLGPIGGRLYPDSEVGAQGARTAIRILRGERPESIPPQVLEEAAPVYDWRELQRWGISEARLPAGSVVEFREPTFWQQYQGRIIATLSVFLVALMLILGLTANLLRRRQAEKALRKSEDQYRTLSRRLIHAQEEERARLARELHDDVTQRLARLAIDVARVEREIHDAPPGETLREVGESLVRLSGDVHSLSYRLHSSVLEDLGLAEAVKAECERVARQEAIPVEVKLQEMPEPVPRDAALCLFRVTQEALRNVGRHARARTVEVSLRGVDGGLQVSVRDDGVGFNPADHREHPSLGLASMQERVRLLDGELNIESAPGGGTLILAWVPLKERLKAEG
jgi:signal transduction histidine kinase